MKVRYAVGMISAMCFLGALPASTQTPPPMSGVRPIDRNPRYRQSPLHVACRNGELEKVRELLDQEANLEARDFLDRTPIHLAAMWDRQDIVRLLVERGAEINAKDRWGVTPLRRVLLVEQTRNMDRKAMAELLRGLGGTE